MVSDSTGKTPEQRTADTVELLSREAFFSEIEDIVGYQLERYDGSGPKGLLGGELPLESRIFQTAHELADSLPEAAGPEELAAAVTAMTRGAGKAYDPEIIRALGTAEQAGTLGKTLEEQWRDSRASRMSAFMNDE
jgi:response regulator RpfG family c-di-GMP phosphodiesterase